MIAEAGVSWALWRHPCASGNTLSSRRQKTAQLSLSHLPAHLPEQLIYAEFFSFPLLAQTTILLLLSPASLFRRL